MNPKLHFRLLLCGVAIGFATACSRHDPRQNSNPHPQGAARESQPAKTPAAAPSAANEKTGTDSTGRPSDASGGTTGGDTTKKTGQTEPARRP